MSSTKSLTQLILTLLVFIAIVPPVFTERTKAQPTANVTLSNFSFNPQNITIKVGTAITWTNKDTVIYTLWFTKADDGTTYLKAGREGLSDPIIPGSSWSETFNEIITLKYYSFERLWVTGYIIVVQEAPPVSIFTYQPNQPIPDQTVTFDASESYDIDGAIISYTWDFGDGTKQSTTEHWATHSYTNEGTYKVTLTVTDDSGLTGTSSKTLVIAPDTTPPVAEAGPDQTVDEDTAATLDGSGSTDNTGIASYVWTFTDVTTQKLTGVNPSYEFATPGEYVVTLNVTDLTGNWDIDTVTINVQDVTDPVAKAGISQTVVEDAVAEFDARNSSDNSGITSYEWDFGDGTTGTGATATHTYMEPGSYTVTLIVGDAGNNIDTDSIVVTVLLDTDGDGIPDITDTDKDGDEMVDTWEQENGLNALDPADASQDKDGDGLTNLQEFQQGTNPNDYYSPFPLWIAGVAAAAIVAVVALAYFVLIRRTGKQKTTGDTQEQPED